MSDLLFPLGCLGFLGGIIAVVALITQREHDQKKDVEKDRPSSDHPCSQIPKWDRIADEHRQEND